MVNIAINGFGRIGKNLLRVLLSDKISKENINVKVINTGNADPESILFSFKYDTLLGTYSNDIEYIDNTLYVENYKIKIISQLSPEKINWTEYDVEWVVDCTGKFTKRELAQKHLQAGAKGVLISAPATDEDITIIPGINNNLFDKNRHKIVSLGSCTTNAFAPMIKVLDNKFGIERAFMTTVHAYTNSQALLDLDPEQKDLRKKRAAALNIVPTTTGAMKVADKIFPNLKGKIYGHALRVPVPKVSLIDLSVIIKEKNLLNIDLVNKEFELSAQGGLKNILYYCQEPLVSSDYYCNSYSVVIDSLLTQVNNNFIKVFGWYDNEWGYSNRLRDFLLYLI